MSLKIRISDKNAMQVDAYESVVYCCIQADFLNLKSISKSKTNFSYSDI